MNDMRAFWDERARENAPYFIHNELDYTTPDMEAFWTSGEEAVNRLLAEAQAPPIGAHDVVVDIGCGIGRLTRVLAARAARVYALDVSAEMIARARDANVHLDNVEWIVSDGVSLAPLGDDSADVVFSHVVFQHIPDPAITLGYVREMGRVLRSGGWAAFQLSTDAQVHRRHRSSWRLRLARLLRRAPRGQDHAAWIGSAVDPADLRATARDAGLQVATIVHEGTQFCLVRLVAP